MTAPWSRVTAAPIVEGTIGFSKLLELEGAIQKQMDEGGRENPFPKCWHCLALAFRIALAESRPLLIWAIPLVLGRGSRDPLSSELPGLPTPGLNPRRGHISVVHMDTESKGDPHPAGLTWMLSLPYPCFVFNCGLAVS